MPLIESVERPPRWVLAARAKWRYTGSERPEFAVRPGPGQRSVWDFPRPPAIEHVAQTVRVLREAREIARSDRACRVCETASPPTYYVPAADVDLGCLRPAERGSWCEWKGEPRYWDLEIDGRRQHHVAWSYPDPFPEFESIRDHLAFYASGVDCWVGSVLARPQPGGFYGGWVTPDLVGPFKGDPGIDDL